MNQDEMSEKLANEHVDWYLASIRPLLIEFMKHGFKHGVEWISELPREKNLNEPKPKRA